MSRKMSFKKAGTAPGVINSSNVSTYSKYNTPIREEFKIDDGNISISKL